MLLLRIALLGIGATVVLDLWLQLLKRLGVPTMSVALLGRWVGHLLRGRFAHAAIAKAPALPQEALLGWLAHYAIGIAFAALLIAVQGSSWLARPTLPPALALGIATVVMPLFVMQPAMGAGFAASRTPTPLLNCLRSLLNHAVFGLGLYLTARALA
ncbi:DUF2938 domain-containing protein [Roseateles violae]|uniref:DUF2938 domain-containing protein n=1 Tax=Roseateles violae TaxID=3058042 RepID=A0ABT8DQ91_9BURK|nr:DUF2938 domain-containing protein [Pelomonas sp. PFR6]MDN3920168.1 DUF2938 domain-containing protein [Pelomonas sp. PFR6]